MSLPVVEGYSVQRAYSLTGEVDQGSVRGSANTISKIRQRHSQQYKTESLVLAEKDGAAAAARQLGPHASRIVELEEQARLSQDKSAVEERLLLENARLKRQLAKQAEGLAIVRKAAARYPPRLWPTAAVVVPLVSSGSPAP